MFHYHIHVYEQISFGSHWCSISVDISWDNIHNLYEKQYKGESKNLQIEFIIGYIL
jgi:hypothetical protein